MIEREEKEWGVRLVTRPFRAPVALANMQIQAEVSTPTLDRTPVIRIVFTGVPIQHPLRPVDTQTWGQALAAVVAEAKIVAEELKTRDAGAAKKTKSGGSSKGRGGRRSRS